MCAARICRRHALQQLHGTGERARTFYDNQLLDHLTLAMRNFIGRQTMLFIATADRNGECDCSFRAGLPGFAAAIDAHRIAHRQLRSE